MDRSVCADDAIASDELISALDSLELHELSSRARKYVVRAKSNSEQTKDSKDERAIAHVRWLSQPARTRIRRPLSPLCPTTIGDAIPPATFWHRPAVQRAAPWVISVSVHLVILLLGLMTFHAHRPRVRGGIPIAGSITTAQLPPVADIATAMQDARVGDEQVPQMQEAMSTRVREPRLESAFDEPQRRSSPSTDLESRDDSPVAMFGIGPQALADSSAGDYGSVDRTSSATPARTSPGATEAKFFGVPGTGQAVVYVCDASGSMTGTGEIVVSQLQRALLAMHQTQVFNVIFFSGRRGPVAFDARDMIPADANSKLSACGFVKRYACAGNSVGLPAIRSALERNPDLMYLVTDGDFDDSDQILATIRRMNADHFTTINVILVSGSAQSDPSSYKFLQQIASENGGTCRVIDPNRM